MDSVFKIPGFRFPQNNRKIFDNPKLKIRSWVWFSSLGSAKLALKYVFQGKTQLQKLRNWDAQG